MKPTDGRTLLTLGAFFGGVAAFVLLSVLGKGTPNRSGAQVEHGAFSGVAIALLLFACYLAWTAWSARQHANADAQYWTDRRAHYGPLVIRSIRVAGALCLLAVPVMLMAEEVFATSTFSSLGLVLLLFAQSIRVSAED